MLLIIIYWWVSRISSFNVPEAKASKLSLERIMHNCSWPGSDTWATSYICWACGLWCERQKKMVLYKPCSASVHLWIGASVKFEESLLVELQFNHVSPSTRNQKALLVWFLLQVSMLLSTLQEQYFYDSAPWSSIWSPTRRGWTKQQISTCSFISLPICLWWWRLSLFPLVPIFWGFAKNSLWHSSQGTITSVKLCRSCSHCLNIPIKWSRSKKTFCCCQTSTITIFFGVTSYLHPKTFVKSLKWKEWSSARAEALNCFCNGSCQSLKLCGTNYTCPWGSSKHRLLIVAEIHYPSAVITDSSLAQYFLIFQRIISWWCALMFQKNGMSNKWLRFKTLIICTVIPQQMSVETSWLLNLPVLWNKCDTTHNLGLVCKKGKKARSPKYLKYLKYINI
jgi:hypothetical protein